MAEKTELDPVETEFFEYQSLLVLRPSRSARKEPPLDDGLKTAPEVTEG